MVILENQYEVSMSVSLEGTVAERVADCNLFVEEHTDYDSFKEDYQLDGFLKLPALP